MALVTDPAFWRRFSIAVHLDEDEKAAAMANSPDGRPTSNHSYVLYPSLPCHFPSTSTPTPPRQPQVLHFPRHNLTPTAPFAFAQANPTRESWLSRQKQKKSRRTMICWIFWIFLASLIAGTIVTVMLLKQYGILGGRKMELLNSAEANAQSDSIGGSGP